MNKDNYQMIWSWVFNKTSKNFTPQQVSKRQ